MKTDGIFDREGMKKVLALLTGAAAAAAATILLIAIFAFMVRNALEQGRQSMVADGLTMSRYPSYVHQCHLLFCRRFFLREKK